MKHLSTRNQITTDFDFEWVHGPKRPSEWKNCVRCSHDTHFCPGCGTWLHHGTSRCGPCGDIQSVSEDGDDLRYFVVALDNKLPKIIGGRSSYAKAERLSEWARKKKLEDVRIVDTKIKKHIRVK